jgi:hypothetical protein
VQRSRHHGSTYPKLHIATLSIAVYGRWKIAYQGSVIERIALRTGALVYTRYRDSGLLENGFSHTTVAVDASLYYISHASLSTRGKHE